MEFNIAWTLGISFVSAFGWIGAMKAGPPEPLMASLFAPATTALGLPFEFTSIIGLFAILLRCALGTIAPSLEAVSFDLGYETRYDFGKRQGEGWTRVGVRFGFYSGYKGEFIRMKKLLD